jgi:hypothetical protein
MMMVQQMPSMMSPCMQMAQMPNMHCYGAQYAQPCAQQPLQCAPVVTEDVLRRMLADVQDQVMGLFRALDQEATMREEEEVQLQQLVAMRAQVAQREKLSYELTYALPRAPSPRGYTMVAPESQASSSTPKSVELPADEPKPGQAKLEYPCPHDTFLDLADEALPWCLTIMEFSRVPKEFYRALDESKTLAACTTALVDAGTYTKTPAQIFVDPEQYTTALRFAAGFPQTRFVLVSERYRPAMLTAVRTIRCKHQVKEKKRNRLEVWLAQDAGSWLG